MLIVTSNGYLVDGPSRLAESQTGWKVKKETRAEHNRNHKKNTSSEVGRCGGLVVESKYPVGRVSIGVE